MAPDDRRHAPATLRNRDPILDVLRRVLPPTGLVLEVASGTGEHAAYFARALPGIRWQPSDTSRESFSSIAAWGAAEGAANLLPPVILDAGSPDWPAPHADAIFCANMVHISPWPATEGLMRGAGRILRAGGPLVLYGPYVRHGHPTAPGNVAFDADLRARDGGWGLRVLEDVVALGEAAGLRLDAIEEMPANNLTVVFRRD